MAFASRLLWAPKLQYPQLINQHQFLFKNLL
jgi:hypothetical protein